MNIFYSKSSLKDNTLSASTKFKFIQQISLKNESGIQKIELQESLKPNIKLIKVQIVLTFEETEQMFQTYINQILMFEDRPVDEEPEIYEYEDETRHRPVVTMEEQAFEQMLNVNN